jgi:hypothetical protein
MGHRKLPTALASLGSAILGSLCRWTVLLASLSSIPLATRAGQALPTRFYVNCPFGDETELYKKPTSDSKVAAPLGCGSAVIELKEGESWTKVRTVTLGWIRSGYIETSKLSATPTANIYSVGYRVVPDPTTLHEEHPGASETHCFGFGTQTYFDQFSSLNLNVNCQTVTTPATSEDIDLGWFHVYQVVEGTKHRYLLHCEAHWSGSNCNGLAPGVFAVWSERGAMWVVARRANAEVYIKYEVLGRVEK